MEIMIRILESDKLCIASKSPFFITLQAHVVKSAAPLHTHTKKKKKKVQLLNSSSPDARLTQAGTCIYFFGSKVNKHLKT